MRRDRMACIEAMLIEGEPDLSVSGDNFDLVVVNPHDPTTTSETRSVNAIAEPTPDGYQPCRRKISLITKINSCTQSKNEQEFEASNQYHSKVESELHDGSTMAAVRL
jgi:hypothetical protein